MFVFILTAAHNQLWNFMYPHNDVQWWIQDFPLGGGTKPLGGANL